MSGGLLALAEVAPGFDRLIGSEAVLLAVSGGADSMAMMHLVADWREARAPHCAPVVATVDHGLRPEAADEARFVALEAAKRGLRHTILRWEGEKPGAGLQAAARDARYRLLAEHARAIGASIIATAHTADDQAETLLMRLARGSGVDGLAAMRPRRALEELSLVRPLLDVPKSRLVATLRARGLPWREDPSNAMPAFERVRLRQAADALGAAGLATTPLCRSAARLARAAEALEAMTARAATDAHACLQLDPLGYARVDWAWLMSQPEEIRLRLLSHLIKAVGGRPDPPSLGQLEAVTVGRGWRTSDGLTLGGVVIGGDSPLTLTREVGRDELPRIGMAAGPRSLWDGRFEVGVTGETAAAGIMVGPLGPVGLALVEAAGGSRPRAPARALWSTPAFWRGAELVAAPLLGFFAGESSSDCFVCDFVRPWPFVQAGYSVDVTTLSE